MSIGKSVLAKPKVISRKKTYYRPILNYQSLNLKNTDVIYSLAFPKDTKTLYLIHLARGSQYKILSDGKKALLTTALLEQTIKRMYPNTEIKRVHEIIIDGWTFKDLKVSERTNKIEKRKEYQRYAKMNHRTDRNIRYLYNVDSAFMMAKRYRSNKFNWEPLALSSNWIVRYINYRTPGREREYITTWDLDRDQYLTLKTIYHSIQKGKKMNIETLKAFEELIPPETPNLEIKEYCNIFSKLI